MKVGNSRFHVIFPLRDQAVYESITDLNWCRSPHYFRPLPQLHQRWKFSDKLNSNPLGHPGITADTVGHRVRRGAVKHVITAHENHTKS